MTDKPNDSAGAREWWISNPPKLGCGFEGPSFDGKVHVIEFSAYLAAIKERDEWKKNYEEVSELLFESGRAKENTMAERDSLRKENASLLDQLRWSIKNEAQYKEALWRVYMELNELKAAKP